MQIIFLTPWEMVISFFIVWPLIQLIVTLICNLFDVKKFNPNSFFLRCHKWENGGKVYKTIFKIHKWKHLLPDGARVEKNGFEKKYLKTYDKEYIREFIYQTGRAEISHWLQIIPFWVFGFWCPFYIIWLMLLYALLVNIPCILAQRYNRPRLIRVYDIKRFNLS
ncbi:MAG: hypothetical protein PQJ49_13580 [Sphaerochaetaceae bacterium]|nr:hypothetical protein [Sphaerochaetaceae bacterium]MDC7236184.1 hypothetical protein [Sphaerochaetaceae bacterium]MDC7250940.1 hypothetical protein [Sphaerochaetaceae bacterium]